MKYLTSLGCSLFGVLGFVGVPRLALAQDPSAPPAPPVPTEQVAPAPAPGTGMPPATESGTVAPDEQSPAANPPPVAPAPSASPAPEPAPTGSAPAPSGDEPQAATETANAERTGTAASARTWQIPAVEPGTPEDEPAPQGFSGQLGSHQDHWIAWLGVRNDYVRDANFDLFAGNDALTVFSVGAGRTVWKSGNLSLAALGLWEIGSRSDEIRGNATSLRVQRFQVAPEGRYHLHYRLYGFVRLGIGANRLRATLEDELLGGDLVSNSWAFSGDLTGGAAVQFVGPPSGEQRMLRGWIVAEGGYALATSSSLSFEAADDASIPERAASEELGELNLSAPFFRVAVRGTY